MKKVYASAFLIVLCGAHPGPVVDRASLLRVDFVGAAQPFARLRADRAAVYNAAGLALFNASEDYIRAYARSPTGRVQAWDLKDARVRISSGERETWLSCGDLLPMAIACSDVAFVGHADGSVEVSSAPSGVMRGGGSNTGLSSLRANRLPNCPGSLLCPKL